MKSIFILLLGSALVNSIYAQQSPINCQVDLEFLKQSALEVPEQQQSKFKTSFDGQNQLKYIPIKVNWVRNTDGSFSKNNDPAKFFDVMLKINEEFSPIGVQFVVSSDINYIDNTAYLSTDRSSQTFRDLKAIKEDGVANVWIVDSWIGSPASGYGGPGGVELAEIGLQIDGHEFGHFMSLAHTFDIGNGIENVARTGADANCDTNGDGVCDTNADPYGLKPGQFLGAAPAKGDNCAMTSATTDLTGAQYDPPYNNYMSYYGGCGYIFTPGQFAKMEAGYAQYHSNYKQLTTGIVSGPTQVSLTTENDIVEVSWADAVGGVGIQVEYSSDNGASWEVMNIANKGGNRLAIHGLNVGTDYQLRLRHLNSYTYSNVLTYSPTLNTYCLPPTENTPTTTLGGIGSFIIVNTTINNLSNTNENYSITNPADSIIMFPGGSYDFRLGVQTDAATGGAQYTYYKIWIDENQDGDFNDVGEFKYQSTQFEYNTSGTFSIAANARVGKTRLRVRTFPSLEIGGPCNFSSFGETEDYVINIVEDAAPVLETVQFVNASQEIELSWSDNTSQFGYTILRSTDGINFTSIGKAAAGQTSFSDTQLLPHTFYGYKVTRQSSAKISNELTVITGSTSSAVCTPVISNPCAVGYDIKEFAIADVGFQKQSDPASCNASAGFSNFIATDTIRLDAGIPHTFTMENNNHGFEHVLISADLNQNGIFEDSEELFQYSNQGVPITQGIINIPRSASNGVTTFRVRGAFNAIPDACGISSYGETEDYAVMIAGAKQERVQEFAFGANSDTEATLSWVLPSGSGATGVELLQSIDGMNFTSIGQVAADVSDFTVSTLSASTRYYFQAITKGGVDSEPALTWGSTQDASDPIPTVTLTSAVGSLTNQAFTVNAITSIATTDLEVSDLSVSNATISNFTGAGTDYSFEVAAAGDGALSVSVNANAFANANGDGNSESNAISTVFDGTRPTVNFSALTNSLVNFAPNITFNLSEEAVLTANDLTLVNGTDSAFSKNGLTYNAIVKPTADGEVRISIPENTFSDAAGNQNEASPIFTFQFDGSSPTIVLASTSAASVSSPFEISVDVSESASALGANDLTVTNGSLSNLAQVANSYTATVVPASDGEVRIEIPADVITDPAGNGNTSSNILTRTYITGGLTATLSTSATDSVNAAFSVSINTSAATSDLVAADLTVVNASVSNFTGSGTSYSFDLLPVQPGNVSVEIPADRFTDGSLQNLTSNTLERVFDNVSPTVALSSQPISGGIILDIAISESVIGFTPSDIQVVNGTLTGFTNHGQGYTVQVNRVANEDLTVSIPGGAFTDFAGNANTASNSINLVGERESPTVVLSTDAPALIPASVPSFEVTISLSEDVVHFESSDVVIQNGVINGFSGDHRTYRALIAPTSEGTVSVSIPDSAFSDLNRNFNLASNVLNRTIDLTSPLVDFTSMSGDTVNTDISVSVTASEALQSLDELDFTLRNASISGFTTVAPDAYSFTLRPIGTGEFSVSLKGGRVEDLAGNKTKDDSFLHKFYKTVGPAISLFSSSPDSTNQSVEIDIVVSEAVDDFDASDIQTSIGNITAFSGSGTQYSATVSELTTGLLTIVVPAGKVMDALGNTNPRSNTISRNIDVTGPEVVISAPGTTVTDDFQISFAFSEVPVGFTQDDILVTNGSLQDFRSISPISFSARVLVVADGPVNVSIAENSFADQLGNTNAFASLEVTYNRVLQLVSDKVQLFYPNPVSDILFLRAEKVHYVSLYSLSGVLVKKVKKKSQIDVSDLDAGVYVLLLKDASGNDVAKEKLIISKEE